jgi:hypothetical protein
MNETQFKIFIGMLLISLLIIPIAIVVTIFKFTNKHEKKK